MKEMLLLQSLQTYKGQIRKYYEYILHEKIQLRIMYRLLKQYKIDTR